MAAAARAAARAAEGARRARVEGLHAARQAQRDSARVREEELRAEWRERSKHGGGPSSAEEVAPHYPPSQPIRPPPLPTHPPPPSHAPPPPPP
jgi:hypothetical protein